MHWELLLKRSRTNLICTFLKKRKLSLKILNHNLIKKLSPIPDLSFDKLEKDLIDFIKEEIFQPLAKELKVESSIKNALQDELDYAIQSNRIFWSNDGYFSGTFTTSIRKALVKLGAKWKKGVYRIDKQLLPIDVIHSIAVSELNFTTTLQAIDAKLAALNPNFSKLKLVDRFNKDVFKLNKTFQESVKAVGMDIHPPQDQLNRISEEYAENLEKSIRGWTEEKILDLREKIQKSFYAGDRYKEIKKIIEKEYNISRNKATFLARQETRLLSAKFKEVRYEDAGITHYIWKTVSGTDKHPVRPDHKILDGDLFRFDDPPVVDHRTGRRGNPGEDFNCRCIAIPVIPNKPVS